MGFCDSSCESFRRYAGFCYCVDPAVRALVESFASCVLDPDAGTGPLNRSLQAAGSALPLGCVDRWRAERAADPVR